MSIEAKESTTGSGLGWPIELRFSADRRRLTVSFDNGVTHVLDAEYLRVESPSAEVQGHSPAEKRTIGGKRDVAVVGIDRIGHYAVRLTFDDMHSSGIYSWDYLYELGRDHETRWRRYLDDLARAGLTRDPARR